MKGRKRISLLAVLVCLFALVFSLGLLSACGTTDDQATADQWYYGAEVPADTFGKEGDHYLNTKTLASYVKSGDGTWTATDVNWYYGTEAPVPTLGASNDFYLNTKSGELYQKKADGWGSPILTLQGEKGEKGRDGILWFSGESVPEATDPKLKDAIVGDFYLETTNFEVYQKTSDTKWELLGSIMGHVGTMWFHGNGAPEDDTAAQTARVGDYYMRLFAPVEGYTGYHVYVKEESGWRLLVNNDVCHVKGHMFGENNICPNCGLENMFAGEGLHKEEGGDYIIEKAPEGVTDLVIPSNVNGEPVKIEPAAFAGNKTIQSVTFEEGITEIPDAKQSIRQMVGDVPIYDYTGLFNGCLSLISIELPQSLKKIGSYAFYGCQKLESVVFPQSLEKIGSDAFGVCKDLKSIEIPGSVTEIGAEVFEFCESLTTAIFDDGVKETGESMFRSCQKLECVVFKGAIEKIGPSTFFGCIGLKEFAVPDSVTIIGSSAFDGCLKLQSVTIGAAVREIGGSAFSGCGALTTINMKSTVLETIGSGAFTSCNKLEGFVIPSTVTTLGSSAFSNCTLFTEMTIPASITSIEGNTFTGCTALERVEILGNVTKIGSGAFNNCKSLTEITLPDSVTEIGARAFSGCTVLETVRIGTVHSSLVKLAAHSSGASAFSGCTSLAKIYFAGTKEEWSALSGQGVTGGAYVTLNTATLLSSCPAGCTVTFSDGSKIDKNGNPVV